MVSSERDVEKEADNLEKQSKIEIQQRNYKKAIHLLEKAKKLNIELGYKGQVKVINKKIEGVHNLISFEESDIKSDKREEINKINKLEKEGDNLLTYARKFEFNKEYSKAIKKYTEALNIYNQLGYSYQIDKIKKEINKIKVLNEQYKKEIKTPENDSFNLEKLPNRTNILNSKDRSEMNQEKRLRKISLEEFEKKKAEIESDKRKAEECLDKGNLAIRRAEFDIARKFYKKSIQYFKLLGWNKQIIILEKELNNIDSYEEEHQERLRNISQNNISNKQNSNNSSYLINETQNLHSKLKKDVLTNGLNDINRNKVLLESEKRRNVLRQKTEENIRKSKERDESLKRIEERQKRLEKENSELKKKSVKTREMETKKKVLLMEAEKALDKAKNCVDNNQYEKAREFYRTAIKIFKDLKWFDQVDVLYKEIKNLEAYKREYLKNLKEEEKRKKQLEMDYEKRIQKLKSESEFKKRSNLRDKQSLPKDIKKELERARMLLKKAEKEYEVCKYDRVLSRYNIILKIYRSIPKDLINFENEINELNSKIQTIKSKIV
ncbi:MAG: hypothetical protein P8Y70_11435 [Candidatus Lokiarchaeota archaeon]